MSDIFVSCARSTEADANRIADALRAAGYGEWIDDQLPAHRAYGDVIEERLAAAKAVVVIWSADAARSEWVRAEADAAREQRKLVQLTVVGARLPALLARGTCRSTRSSARISPAGATTWMRPAGGRSSPASTSSSAARPQGANTSDRSRRCCTAFQARHRRPPVHESLGGPGARVLR